MKRIVCIFLVICMMALSLVSCTGKDNDDTKNPPEDNTPADSGEVDKWADVSFGDESIIVSISNLTYSAAISAGATNAVKYMVGPDSYTTDPV